MDVLSFRDYCLSLPLTEESTPFDETTTNNISKFIFTGINL